MSIEIWQFPKVASRDQLIESLKNLGFEVGENLFWPGPEGTVNLFWSQPLDFQSISGVDASVFPLDNKGKAAWKTTNDWALRTRTSIWASSFDQEHQNRTVRTIRKLFGGTFYNDHFGHNRYIVIERVKSTPASRGIYGVLTRLEGELDRLEHTLPEEMTKSLMTPKGEITDENDESGILQFTKQFDPSCIVYNALVPFLVAALEHFFRETFEILLKYDATVQKILEDQNRKLSYSEATALARGELTLERIASSWFSFQNVDSIQKAYKDIHGIDVWKALRRRKKVRDRLPILMSALQNLIGARHGVVHHFSIDRELDREGFLSLLHLVRAILEVMGREIEKKLDVQLGPG
ncbi:MAG: hypothetical protein Q6358_01515 [Candidatus Brocadiales bacterium]|nr:hypothetical protein [Candidatus Brocadiales bacterium]